MPLAVAPAVPALLHEESPATARRLPDTQFSPPTGPQDIVSTASPHGDTPPHMRAELGSRRLRPNLSDSLVHRGSPVEARKAHGRRVVCRGRRALSVRCALAKYAHHPWCRSGRLASARYRGGGLSAIAAARFNSPAPSSPRHFPAFRRSQNGRRPARSGVSAATTRTGRSFAKHRPIDICPGIHR